MSEKEKGNQNGRIRYDEDFKNGAIRMVTEQHLPIKKLPQNSVSTDSLRS